MTPKGGNRYPRCGEFYPAALAGGHANATVSASGQLDRRPRRARRWTECFVFKDQITVDEVERIVI